MSECRICGNILSEDTNLCPNCGRIAVLFPDPLPNALQQCLAEEKSFYEQQVASEKDIQQELGEKKAKIKELEKTVATLQTKLEQKQKEIEVLETAKKSLKSEGESLEKKLKEKEKECAQKDKSMKSLKEELQANKAYLDYRICSKCGTPFVGPHCVTCPNDRPSEPKRVPEYEYKVEKK